MAKLSSLIGGGGGASINYEPADTQDQILEVGKKYLVTKNVTNVRLPNTSGLQAGATIIIKPANRTNYASLTISAFNLMSDTIAHRNSVFGLGSTVNAVVTLEQGSSGVDRSSNEHVFIFTGSLWEYQYSTNIGSGYQGADEGVTDDLYIIEFNSSTDWIAPSSGNIVITLVGGGGGGPHPASDYHKGAGGGGAVIWQQSVPVVEGVTYPVEVGGGGSAGARVNQTAGTGGSSSFGGSLLVASGGGGGSGTFSGAGGTFSSNALTITNGYNGGRGGARYSSNVETITTVDGQTLTGDTFTGGFSAYPPYGRGANVYDDRMARGGDGVVIINMEDLF